MAAAGGAHAHAFIGPASPAAHSSRASSVSAESGASGASDGDAPRPSFKRLPSQTLGPAAAKRAFLGFGDNDERVSGWGVGSGPPPGAGQAPAEGAASTSTAAPALSGAASVGAPGGGMHLSHPDRVVASLAERRRRRMSAPSASFGLLEPDHGQHVSISHSSRGSQEQSAQRQQAQQDYHDKQGSMGGRDMLAVYAPAGPGGI